MTEKKILYLGTDPSHYSTSKNVQHYPLIEMMPRNFQDFGIKCQFQDMPHYTHIILTSKNAIRIFLDALAFYHIPLTAMQGKQWICIGSSTTKTLQQYGAFQIATAQEETQEGVIKLLDLVDLENGYLFYPRSSRARPTLSCYLKVRQLRHQICDLYDTHAKAPAFMPHLSSFDEIIFTSPSTVEAFFEIFSTIPSQVKLTPVGPITKASLQRFQQQTLS